METPQEKANELIKKFIEPTKIPNIKGVWVDDIDGAKQCALILVEEILGATVKYKAFREKVDYSKTGFDNVVHTIYDPFWLNVKKELCKENQ